ncbi:MAG: hypothetical protein ACSHX8_13675 [Opitutaceae bacterium]
MIHFILTYQHRYTMESFMDSWAPELKPHLKLLYFKDLWRMKVIPNGCYIFSDLERLDEKSRKLIHRFRSRLDCLDPQVQVLNEPSQFLNRYDLLKKLKAAGINKFDVHRCRKELSSEFRYPVFFRELHGHGEKEIELIKNADAFHTAYDKLAEGRGAAAMEHDFIVIEHIDTSDAEGIFRKYSYVKLGPHLIPRHLLFDTNWVVKYTKFLDEVHCQEEIEFVQHGRDEDQIDAIFKLAGVDYGRIDYGYDRDGNIQVWEINTNPGYGTRESTAAERFETVEVNLKQLENTFIEVSENAPKGEPMKVSALQRALLRRHTDKYALRQVK